MKPMGTAQSDPSTPQADLSAEKDMSGSAKRKRGRPPKARPSVVLAEEGVASLPLTDSQSPVTPKRGRGRPRKSALSTSAQPSPAGKATPTSAARGRPKKGKSEDVYHENKSEDVYHDESKSEGVYLHQYKGANAVDVGDFGENTDHQDRRSVKRLRHLPQGTSLKVDSVSDDERLNRGIDKCSSRSDRSRRGLDTDRSCDTKSPEFSHFYDREKPFLNHSSIKTEGLVRKHSRHFVDRQYASGSQRKRESSGRTVLVSASSGVVARTKRPQCDSSELKTAPEFSSKAPNLSSNSSLLLMKKRGRPATKQAKVNTSASHDSTVQGCSWSVAPRLTSTLRNRQTSPSETHSVQDQGRSERKIFHLRRRVTQRSCKAPLVRKSERLSKGNLVGGSFLQFSEGFLEDEEEEETFRLSLVPKRGRPFKRKRGLNRTHHHRPREILTSLQSEDDSSFMPSTCSSSLVQEQGLPTRKRGRLAENDNSANLRLEGLSQVRKKFKVENATAMDTIDPPKSAVQKLAPLPSSSPLLRSTLNTKQEAPLTTHFSSLSTIQPAIRSGEPPRRGRPSRQRGTSGKTSRSLTSGAGLGYNSEFTDAKHSDLSSREVLGLKKRGRPFKTRRGRGTGSYVRAYQPAVDTSVTDPSRQEPLTTHFSSLSTIQPAMRSGEPPRGGRPPKGSRATRRPRGRQARIITSSCSTVVDMTMQSDSPRVIGREWRRGRPPRQRGKTSTSSTSGARLGDQSEFSDVKHSDLFSREVLGLKRRGRPFKTKRGRGTGSYVRAYQPAVNTSVADPSRLHIVCVQPTALAMETQLSAKEDIRRKEMFLSAYKNQSSAQESHRTLLGSTTAQSHFGQDLSKPDLPPMVASHCGGSGESASFKMMPVQLQVQQLVLASTRHSLLNELDFGQEIVFCGRTENAAEEDFFVVVKNNDYGDEEVEADAGMMAGDELKQTGFVPSFLHAEKQKTAAEGMAAEHESDHFVPSLKEEGCNTSSNVQEDFIDRQTNYLSSEQGKVNKGNHLESSTEDGDDKPILLHALPSQEAEARKQDFSQSILQEEVKKEACPHTPQKDESQYLASCDVDQHGSVQTVSSPDERNTNSKLQAVGLQEDEAHKDCLSLSLSPQNEAKDRLSQAVSPQVEERESFSQSLSPENDAKDCLLHTFSAQGEARLSQSVNSQDEASLSQSVNSQDEARLSQSVNSQDEASLPQSVNSQDEAHLSQSVNSQDGDGLSQSFNSHDEEYLSQAVTPPEETNNVLSQTVTHQSEAMECLKQTGTHQDKAEECLTQTGTHQSEAEECLTQTGTHQDKVEECLTQTGTHQDKAEECLTQTITHQSEAKECLTQTVTHQSEAKECLTQTVTHQSEAEECLTQTATHQSEVEECLTQTGTHQSEVEECLTQTGTHQSEVEECLTQTGTHQSEVEECLTQTITQESEVEECLTQTITQEIEVEECLTQTGTHQGKAEECLTQTVTHESAAEECLTQTGTHQGEAEECLTQTGTNQSEAEECLTQATVHQGKTGDCLPETFTHHGEAEKFLTQPVAHQGEGENCLTQTLAHRSEVKACLSPAAADQSKAEQGFSPTLTHHDEAEECLTQTLTHQGEAEECLTQALTHHNKAEECLTQTVANQGKSEECASQTAIQKDVVEDFLLQTFTPHQEAGDSLSQTCIPENKVKDCLS